MVSSSSFRTCTEYMKHWRYAASMLQHRLRRWLNNESAGQAFEQFASLSNVQPLAQEWR